MIVKRPTFTVLPGITEFPQVYEEFVRLPPFTTVTGSDGPPARAGIDFLGIEFDDACLGYLSTYGITPVMSTDEYFHPVHLDPDALLAAGRSPLEVAAWEYLRCHPDEMLSKVPVRHMADAEYYWILTLKA